MDINWEGIGWAMAKARSYRQKYKYRSPLMAMVLAEISLNHRSLFAGWRCVNIVNCKLTRARNLRQTDKRSTIYFKSRRLTEFGHCFFFWH